MGNMDEILKAAESESKSFQASQIAAQAWCKAKTLADVLEILQHKSISPYLEQIELDDMAVYQEPENTSTQGARKGRRDKKAMKAVGEKIAKKIINVLTEANGHRLAVKELGLTKDEMEEWKSDNTKKKYIKPHLDKAGVWKAGSQKSMVYFIPTDGDAKPAKKTKR